MKKIWALSYTLRREKVDPCVQYSNFSSASQGLACISLVSLGGLMGLAQSSCLGENGDGSLGT